MEFTLPPYIVNPRILTDDSITQRLPWHLEMYNIPKWQEVCGAGEGIRVGICDTGVVEHSALSSRVVGVYDMTRSASGPNDIHGHGTHVAGTVAADKVGVAPKAEIVSVKCLGDNGSGTNAMVAAGIRKCIAEGCHVINLSLGSPALSMDVRDAVMAASDAGVFVVCASGNEASDVGFPAAIDEATLAVNAHDQAKRIAVFSNRGKSSDVSGPGVDIVSCSIRGGYVSMSGTSMSSPFVSGMLALRLSFELKHYGAIARKPMAERYAALKTVCEDLGKAGRDDLYGWGRLDPAKLYVNGHVGDDGPVEIPSDDKVRLVVGGKVYVLSQEEG